MSKTFVYLVYFGVYSLAILFIGKSSFGESDSISKFFVGERKIGLCRLFFTFVGTWISAATILGYTGNVYQNRVAVISMSVIPWFIGALMLYAISNRLYDNDILTIPQLIPEPLWLPGPSDCLRPADVMRLCALPLSCRLKDLALPPQSA